MPWKRLKLSRSLWVSERTDEDKLTEGCPESSGRPFFEFLSAEKTLRRLGLNAEVFFKNIETF